MAAQTAPCGREILIANGAKSETRFLPASPAFVKERILTALPSLGALAKHAGENSLEARHNLALLGHIAERNQALGYKTNQGLAGAPQNIDIEWKADTQGGVNGTEVKISTHKLGIYFGYKYDAWATTLMDEIACLVKVTSPWDSATNPTGKVEGAAPVGRRSVVVPEGTPIKLVLPNAVSAKEIKDKKSEPLVLQVQDDVQVDGAVVIRKGALGVGQYLTAEAAKHWGKGAALAFELKTVTAADGQALQVIGGSEQKKGKNAQVDTTGGLLVGIIALGISKGNDAQIRAGSGYTAETVGQYTIEIGK